MNIEDLLKTDTSELSLSDMIAKVGGNVLDRPDDVYRLRKRHENDSGIQMEEDDFGIREKDGIHGAFPEIVKSLNDIIEKD